MLRRKSFVPLGPLRLDQTEPLHRVTVSELDSLAHRCVHPLRRPVSVHQMFFGNQQMNMTKDRIFSSELILSVTNTPLTSPTLQLRHPPHHLPALSGPREPLHLRHRRIGRRRNPDSHGLEETRIDPRAAARNLVQLSLLISVVRPVCMWACISLLRVLISRRPHQLVWILPLVPH